jgi:hypothetical protein
LIVSSFDRSKRASDSDPASAPRTEKFIPVRAPRACWSRFREALPGRSAPGVVAISCFICACLSALPVSPAHADAWMQPAGKTYLETSISAYTAEGYYDEGGNALEGDWWDPQSTYSEATISQILEYGWREDVTFLFDARFRSLVVDRVDPGLRDRQVAGLGDIGLGLRKKLPTKSLAAALQGRIEVPGGYDSDRPEYSLGAGEVNLEGRFQLAGTLGGGKRGWWNGEVGYRFRGGDFSDELVALLEAGAGIAGPFSVQLGFDLLSALEDTFVDLADPEQRDPLQYASRASVGGSLRWTVSPQTALALGYSTDVAGENSLQGQTVRLAFELRP